MSLQLDCWESVTAAQVEAALSEFPDLIAWQGYVPGWGRPYGGGWSADAAKAVMSAGLGYLPLLVPVGDPAQTPQDQQGWDEAVVFAEHHVASAGGKLTICGLNVEAPWSSADLLAWVSVAQGFVAACRNSGISSVVYGSPSFISALSGSDAPEVIYAGEWPNGSLPPSGPISLSSIPGIPDSSWDGAGQRIWQYQGGHSVSSLPFAVDSSLTDSSVPYCRLVSVPSPVPDPTPSPVLLGPGTYQVPAGATITIS